MAPFYCVQTPVPHDIDYPQRLRLRQLALVCAALLLMTIVLSAYMRLSQAGLGCEDWPACYGEAWRSPSSEVSSSHAAARLAHRVVATGALALILAMTLMTWTARPPRALVRLLTTALLVLALALAALGIVTPGARTPIVAMGNLLGGFAMLALCWRLVGELALSPVGSGQRLKIWAAGAGMLLVIQLASGALVSASFSGLACTDLADCQRAAGSTGWSWQGLDPLREPRFDLAATHVNLDGGLSQWLHRIGSIVVGAALAMVGVLALRRQRRYAGAALLLMTALQLSLGLLSVSMGLPLPVALLHNLTAAALLTTLVRLG